MRGARKLSKVQTRGVRSLLLRPPGDVVGPRGGAVLVHQLLHHLAGVVQLVKVVLEDVLLAELLQEGLALSQLVVLPARPLEQLRRGKSIERVGEGKLDPAETLGNDSSACESHLFLNFLIKW